MTTEPRPFRVEIPDAGLKELSRRLGATRWAPDFGNEDWTYGVERAWLKDLVCYWREEFDWRAQEHAINELPQFCVEIDGITIHYVHVRGTGASPHPVILSHGWPWTFWDWKDLVGPLSDPSGHGVPSAPAFDVIVPSLPGMGFSTPLRTTKVHARRIAELWAKLMHEVLGYERFGAGGCDWGAIVTGELAHIHPELLSGAWLTMPVIPGRDNRAYTRESFASDEQWMFEQMDSRTRTRAHSTVAALEPQTISYALADSPAGMAAWIWSKRRDWSDHDGQVFDVFDRDFLCTTASIYWLTETIATSMRIYHEQYASGVPPLLHERPRVIDVPTGFAVFPKDNLYVSRRSLADLCNLRRWSLMPRGGHFGPSEQPELCLADLRAFFSVWAPIENCPTCAD